MPAKVILHRYLNRGREAMLWKLEGLSAYDARRPLVPTGTNLLGLVKHLTECEYGYFGTAFGRTPAVPLLWNDPDAGPLDDLFATADESVADIVEGYRAACAHADATILALALDDFGEVPWWAPESRRITLNHALAHMIAETHRHAGHADLLRELIDGEVGFRPDATNLPDGFDWPAHRDHLEQLARDAE